MIVLLDDAVNQLLLVPSDRELSQTLRTGPLGRPLDDTSFVETDAAFSGVGLRPYSPCHVKKVGHKFTWTRRTRVGGDNWSTSSVPLGEETEAYRVRVRLGGAIVREEEVSATEWTYSPVAKMEDGVETNYELEIAQLSAEFGAGGAVYFAVSE